MLGNLGPSSECNERQNKKKKEQRKKQKKKKKTKTQKKKQREEGEGQRWNRNHHRGWNITTHGGFHSLHCSIASTLPQSSPRLHHRPPPGVLLSLDLDHFLGSAGDETGLATWRRVPLISASSLAFSLSHGCLLGRRAMMPLDGQRHRVTGAP